MKVLTGIYSKDSGSIVFEGKEVSCQSPGSTGCRNRDRTPGVEYVEPSDSSTEHIYRP